jgi:O-antigen ligase
VTRRAGFVTLSAGVGLRPKAGPAAALALAVAAAVLGAAAGRDPGLGVAIAAALAVVLVAFSSLTAGLAILVVAGFVAGVGPLAGANALKALGVLLVAAWFTRLFDAERSALRLPQRQPILVGLLAAFVVWTAASAIWSTASAPALEYAYRFLLSFTLFLLLATAVRRIRDAEIIVAAFIVGTAGSALYGVLTGAGEAGVWGPERLGGAAANPNQLASWLVTGAVLALALVPGRRSLLLKSALVGTSAFFVAVMFLTVSRSGLIALVVVMVAGVCLGGRWRLRILIAGLATVVMVVSYFTLIASPQARERVTSVGDGGTGRSDLWTMAGRMIEDKPVLGVGAGNFQVTSVDYLVAPGVVRFDEFIVEDPLVTHNMYLQVLAELGPLGLALFLIICGLSLAATLTAGRRFGARGDETAELLCRGVLLAAIAMLATNVFASEMFDKQLWIPLALGPALLIVADSERATDAHRTGSRSASPRDRSDPSRP